MSRHHLPIPLALLLAACSATPDDPGRITPDEERRLNEAAEALDANGLAPDGDAMENEQ